MEEALASKSALQTQIFDDTESLLAAWARLSNLFCPPRDKDKARGKELIVLFGLDSGIQAQLCNRRARDAWVHFDERLQDGIDSGDITTLQTFRHSSELSPTDIRRSARLFIVDRRHLYLKDRSGASIAVNLDDLNSVATFVALSHGQALTRA